MSKSRKRYTAEEVAAGIDAIWQKQRQRWKRAGACEDCGCRVPWMMSHQILCRSGWSEKKKDREIRKHFHRDFEPCICWQCMKVLREMVGVPEDIFEQGQHDEDDPYCGCDDCLEEEDPA